MIPPWAAELEVTEQRLKRYLMAAIQASNPAAARTRTLSFQVVRHLLLDDLGLDGCQKLLGLPEAQPDILQARLVALQTGDLLQALTRFGFGGEVDEESHPRRCHRRARPAPHAHIAGAG